MLSLRIVLLVAPPLVLLASPAAAQSGEHRWSGLVADPFVLETAQGTKAWSAEDGGRIRFRNPTTGVWSFQDTPDEVKDTLHRVHFLSSGAQAGLTGWAVGQSGWVLKTTNGGTSWTTVEQIPNPDPFGVSPHEELWDIHFLDEQEGWLVGLHSLWYSDDGGDNWATVAVKDGIGSDDPLSMGWPVELYSLDIVVRGDGTRVGLIVGQPGIVLRNRNQSLQIWEVVWEITNLCPNPPPPCGSAGSVLSGCECDFCVLPHTWFEAWDVEISRHATDKLALFVGGIGAQCGMVFASTNDGTSWAKEYHECTCPPPGPLCVNCAGLPLYNDDPSNPNDLTRHKHFKTLYGVGIYDGDNSAFAVGYNGQVVVRNPATGVWQDRSAFSPHIPTTAGSVIFPLYGADAGPGTGATSLGVLGGTGGHLRESINGGHAWTNAQGPNGPIVGGPHRINDVFFKDDSIGWQVGQFFRIAKTINGGIHWNKQDPDATAGAGSFQAITFASDLFQVGVAVGDPFTPAGSSTTQPKIRYTADAGATAWFENVTILANPSFMDRKGLREVEWSGGTSFWSVGQGGLILYSLNDGQTWRQYLPVGETDFHLFELEGVSYLDGTTGIFVGRRPTPSPSGPVRGAAYQRQDIGGSVTWTQLPLPGNLTIEGLWDVDIASSGVAWAVGVKLVAGVREGVVLSSPYSGGTFQAFTEVVNPAGFPRCTAGRGLEEVPVLNEVAVVSTGAVWVGGACGRMWLRSTTGTWTEVQSQTDAHVVGLSDVPSSSACYVAGFRSSNTQQCVVRVQ